MCLFQSLIKRVEEINLQLIKSQFYLSFDITFIAVSTIVVIKITPK